MNLESILSFARETIRIQSEAIAQLETFIDEDFQASVNAIHRSKGRVVITGIGKSALIAQKIVATLNSTGTPSLFMHAADAIHGDLGMIGAEDILIIISKSGESPEIKALVPFIHNFGNKIIALCGQQQSYLAKEADWFLNTYVSKEACPNNLAPTTSTTAQLVMGDALAMSLLKLKGFTATDFAKYHPGGALGKQLYLRMQDLLSENSDKNFVNIHDHLEQIIFAISSSRVGATAVLNDENKLMGVITDGDLRRYFQKHQSLVSVNATSLMHESPITIEQYAMAVEGVQIINQHKISQLIVVNENGQYLGMVHWHELMREGLI